MMVRLLILLCLLASPALGQGFACTDLRRLNLEAAFDEGWVVVGPRERQATRLVCVHWPGDLRVDVTIGRLTDSTEADVRAGRLTGRSLQRRCRERSPGCRVEMLAIAPAVGWMTRFEFGADGHAAVVIALRGGDQPSVRVHSTDPELARDIARRLVRTLLPTVIGT